LLLLLFPAPACSGLFPSATLFRSLLDGAESVQPWGAGLRVAAGFGFAEQVVADGLQALRVDEVDNVDLAELGRVRFAADAGGDEDRKSTRLNSSHVKISYAVFCLK